MVNIKVVTDSTAYINESVLKELDISVVPLVMNIGDESFAEGTKYSNEEYYKRLLSFPVWPRTSQPSAGEFVNVFKKLAEEGATSIICILISSGISGTVSSAITAKDMLPDIDITVIDSLCSGSSLGGIVTEAAKAAKAGKSKDEVVQIANFVRDNLTLLFMVDNLECLKRGGRTSGVQAMLGVLLQIKPILYFTKEGIITVFDKVRTRPKALERILDIFREKIKSNPDVEISIMHVQVLEQARELVKTIKEIHPESGEIAIYELGPVIGTHVGPGTLALTFYPRP